MISRIKSKDYETIAGWYKGRGLTAPAWQDLSESGWIVDDRVAAWLLCTNSSVAMIEHLISDPRTVKSLRQQSIRKLIGFMIDTALTLGYTNIIAASRHEAVDKTAKLFGFVETDLKFYLLNDTEQGEKNYGSYLLSNRDEFEED